MMHGGRLVEFGFCTTMLLSHWSDTRWAVVSAASWHTAWDSARRCRSSRSSTSSCVTPTLAVFLSLFPSTRCRTGSQSLACGCPCPSLMHWPSVMLGRVAPRTFRKRWQTNVGLDDLVYTYWTRAWKRMWHVQKLSVSMSVNILNSDVDNC